MTDNKIICKAVLKAEANGYKSIDIQDFLSHNLWEMIIFDIDFAKAFFKDNRGFGKKEENYEYHLCQMVILPDNKRIKYLEKFL